MRPRLIVALLSALACSAPAPAQTIQSTRAGLETRLLHQPLYLRARAFEDQLHYDQAGDLTGTNHPVTFTLSGVDITSVQLKQDRLLLTARRVGLEFKNDVPVRVALDLPNSVSGTYPEILHLEIAAPPSGDYTAALDRIFVTNLAEIAPSLPYWWQPFAQKHLTAPGTSPSGGLGSGAAATANTPTPAADEKFAKIGGAVKAPALLKQQEPDFSPQARALRYSARVLVTLVVDTHGLPTRLSIVRPAGLGLDERALAAVTHYIFQPATRNGEPVPVQVNVDVNFQIF